MPHHIGCTFGVIFGCIFTIWGTYLFIDVERMTVTVPQSFQQLNFDHNSHNNSNFSERPNLSSSDYKIDVNQRRNATGKFRTLTEIIDEKNWTYLAGIAEKEAKIEGIDKKEEKIKEVKQTVAKRRNCYKYAYTEKPIKKANSDPLPPSPIPLDQICQGDDAKNCVPSFVRIKQKSTYYPSRTTKTASCMVHKSMSTINKALSCLLDDPVKFLTRKNNLLNYNEKTACDKYYYPQNRFSSIGEGAERFQITKEKGWQYVMIVRDPIERFLSGYLHMCYMGSISTCARYCNNCGTNLTCFLERELKNMMKVAKTGVIPNTKTSHMAPQSWQCELADHFEKYKFIRYHSDSAHFVDQELTPFLLERNVSTEMTAYIREKLTSSRTKHSTSNSNLKPFLERRIKKSPYLMALLMRLFYNDYRVFGFELPEFPG